MWHSAQGRIGTDAKNGWAMKKFLFCLALLIGLSDGSIILFPGFPLVVITPAEIIVEGISLPIENVKALRYVPDSLVM